MENIYGLLNMNSDILANFALQGREVENNLEAERILKRAARRLKDIEDRMQSDGRKPEFSIKSVNEVIEKVKKSEKDNSVEWSIKELRIVSYHLGRFQSDYTTFDHAVSLFESSWRDLFINGIVFFLMNSWNICKEEQREKIYQMLKYHLNNYKGGIKKYLQLKSNIDFFDQSGPVRLAALLRAKNMVIEDAPVQIGYKSSSLSMPYFSDVIIEFVRKTSLTDYDFLEDLFRSKHSLDRTKKLIFAHMIEDADNKSDGLLQSNVSRVARRVLGDINSATTWSPFAGATPEECNLLKKAKDLVTAWYARKSVEAFFDICVQDPRRRKCWLEYVQNVSDFRIVGSTSTRTKLQSDSTVAPLLRTCFIETNSRVSTTAALVLFMRDKVFVEFSDVGSLYIYNSANKVVRSIKSKRYLDSTAELKEPSMGVAVEQVSSWSHYYADEGKITHRGEWEDRFRRWMRNKLGVNPGQKLEYKSTTVKESPRPVANQTFQGITPSVTESKSQSRDNFTPQRSLFDDDETLKGSESKDPYPGTRIKTEVVGIQSKWVFNDSVRIMADPRYVYLYVKRTGRTYYLCPNPVKKVLGCNLWMASTYNSEKIFDVKLAVQNPVRSESPTRYNLGKLTWKDSDAVFTPLNGNNVVIHLQ